MNYTAKKQACTALCGEKIFSETTVTLFLQTSDYKTKEDWVANIQKRGQTCHYVTSLENDISKRRRQSFRLLSKLQVQEILPLVKNKKIEYHKHISHLAKEVLHGKKFLYFPTWSKLLQS